MGFSSELCTPQGHGVLQQMQEAELRLLEGMRKWMAQRVKSDREYAGLLHHMSVQDSGGQSRGISPDSPISQVGLHGTLVGAGCNCLLLPLPGALWGSGWRFGRPSLGSHCPLLPASPICAV